jgi:hypothetical protein
VSDAVAGGSSCPSATGSRGGFSSNYSGLGDGAGAPSHKHAVSAASKAALHSASAKHRSFTSLKQLPTSSYIGGFSVVS